MENLDSYVIRLKFKRSKDGNTILDDIRGSCVEKENEKLVNCTKNKKKYVSHSTE